MEKKKKRMTNKEKQERAAMKKSLQNEGLIPPDKPRLNRKRFIEEAETEWIERDPACPIWDLYVMQAIFCMLVHEREGRISLEAVGAAKVLKLAMMIQKFELEMKGQRRDEYAATELCEYIRDIMNA